jgi:hypothetical protein
MVGVDVGVLVKREVALAKWAVDEVRARSGQV